MNIHYKPKCSWGAMGPAIFLPHNVHMAKKRHFLRQWRKHSGKTLEQVAEHLHMTHGNLSKIERGMVPYNEDLLDKLADLYMCEPVDLLIRDPGDPDGIWSIWEHAAPGEKAKIVTIARTIVGTVAA